MRNGSHPTIVVGYDGSAASRAAVEAAIEQAGTDGHIVIVHAFHVPADYVGAPYYESLMRDSAERAEAVLDDLEFGCEQLKHVDYEREVVLGAPADVVCRVAGHRKADQIVLGTRGLGRFRGLLGSVAHEVLHHAHCPVLVIPQRMLDQH